jgi:hypothetical protein
MKVWNVSKDTPAIVGNVTLKPGDGPFDVPVHLRGEIGPILRAGILSTEDPNPPAAPPPKPKNRLEAAKAEAEAKKKAEAEAKEAAEKKAKAPSDESQLAPPPEPTPPEPKLQGRKPRGE